MRDKEILERLEKIDQKLSNDIEHLKIDIAQVKANYNWLKYLGLSTLTVLIGLAFKIFVGI